MKPEKFNTYTEAYIGAIKHLLSGEALTKSPRGMKVNYIQNCNFTIDDVSTVYSCDSRKYNWKYSTNEIEVYLSGDCTVDKFSTISKFWKQLANPDGETINSNYGYRILHKPIIATFPTSVKTQWEFCKQQLITDIDTRQALMFVSGQDVQFDSNKDFICTLVYTFDVSPDKKLNLTVSRRSQDLHFGLPYDYVWEVFLMHKMHNELKPHYPELELGSYTLFCNNLHIYERNNEVFKNMISDYDSGKYENDLILPHIEKYL